MNRMRHIGVMGLCLLAVLAMGAVLAASASAGLPERGKCKTAKIGMTEFEDKGCTTTGTKEKFAWAPNVKAAFTATSGAAVLRTRDEEGSLPAVECAKSKTKGSYIGPKGSEFTTTFEKCSSAGEICTGGAKAKAGQIVTNKLEGTIGFISSGVVGEDIKAVGGGVIAAFKCGANELETDGSVIAEIGSSVYNKAASSATLTFKESGGVQEPTKLKNQPEDTLHTEIDGLGSGSFPFQSTETAVETAKPGLEIKTTGPPKWWVGGSVLVGAEPLAATTTVPMAFELNMTGKDIVEPFVLRCNAVSLKKAEIEGPSTRREEAVVYENCEVPTKPACAVANTETEPLIATLEGVSGNAHLNFLPQAGKKLATYIVTGGSCKVKGEYEANGNMRCNYSNVQFENFEHSLEFTAGSGSAVKFKVVGKTGETAAAFTGTDEVHLASGKLWSAF